MIASLGAALATLMQAPAVSVRLADTAVTVGARLDATVEVPAAGVLVVLCAGADGRPHVVFPARPGDDARVSGGRLALSMRAGDAAGPGLVLAARLPARVAIAGLTVGAAWDPSALIFQPTAGDRLAALLAIAERLSGGRPFNWAAAHYRVTGPIATAGVLAPGEWYARQADLVGEALAAETVAPQAACAPPCGAAAGAYPAPAAAPVAPAIGGPAPLTFYPGFPPYFLPRERIVLPRRFIEGPFDGGGGATPAPPTPPPPSRAARAVYVRGRLAVQ